MFNRKLFGYWGKKNKIYKIIVKFLSSVFFLNRKGYKMFKTLKILNVIF